MRMNNSNWYVVIIIIYDCEVTQLGPALYLGVFGHRVMTVLVR